MPSASLVLTGKEFVNATTASPATPGPEEDATPTMDALLAARADRDKNALRVLASIAVTAVIVALVPSVIQLAIAVSANLSTSVILMFFVFRVSAFIQTKKNQVNLLTLASIFLSLSFLTVSLFSFSLFYFYSSRVTILVMYTHPHPQMHIDIRASSTAYPSAPVCTPGCGSQAHCIYSQPSNKCICNQGYTGNPYKACSLVPKCDGIECGSNAVCLEGSSSVECVCPAGYHGNPYVGCEGMQCHFTLLWHRPQLQFTFTQEYGLITILFFLLLSFATLHFFFHSPRRHK